MVFSDHAALPYQIQYTRCYLSARSTDGTYGAWVDISRYVVGSNLGTYTKSIDSNDFDIGFYEESNVQITLDNTSADFMQGSGFFSGALVDRSKVKLVAGYINTENLVPEYETTFEGIIDDRGTAIDADNENASFSVLAYSSIMGRLRTDPGAVTDGQSFKAALYNLLNRAEVIALLTISVDNITPKIDLTIDDASWFGGQQLKESVNALLLASNSILKIVNNTVFILPRVESSTVRFQFWGKGAVYPCNVVSLKNFNNGLKRVITQVQINTTKIDANDELVDRYGAQLKTIDIGCLSNPETLSAIAMDILGEFQYPKIELELTTDFLGNEVDILDMVTIDNEGVIVDQNPAVYGRAVYELSQFVIREGGVKLKAIEGYKVLSVSHDYTAYTTTFKLRSVGNRPWDSNAGYSNPIYGQAVYALSKYARLDVPGGGGGSGGSGGGSGTPGVTPQPGSPIGLLLALTYAAPTPAPIPGSPIGLLLALTYAAPPVVPPPGSIITWAFLRHV